jgi:uncharacterized protein (DUF2249 family)
MTMDHPPKPLLQELKSKTHGYDAFALGISNDGLTLAKSASVK